MPKPISQIMKSMLVSLILMMVLSFFLKEIWNASIYTQFGGRLMTMASSTGIVGLLFISVRVISEAIADVMVAKFSEMFALLLPPLPPKDKDDNDNRGGGTTLMG